MVSATGPKGDKGERGRPGPSMTRNARRAIVSLFVLTLLLAGANLLFTAHEVNQVSVAAQKAETAAASQLALCRATNTARAEQAGLWEYIIRLSGPRTARERAVRAQFTAHLHVIFAPRDCAALGKGN